MPIPKICVICDASFTVSPSRSGRKYCSHACRNVGYRVPRVEVVCLACGTKSSVHPSAAARKYCNRKCWNAHGVRLPTAPRTSTMCPVCGKATERLPSNAHVAYCDPKCLAESRRHLRTTLECPTCGCEFESLVCKPDRRFCSLACFRKSTGPTSIELILYGILDELGLEYEGHSQVGRWNVDALVRPGPSWPRGLAIECDGDYWHTLPNVARKDIRKEADLARRGLVVLRYWGTELREHRNEIRDYLAAFV